MFLKCSELSEGGTGFGRGGMFVGGFIPKAAGLRAGDPIHYSLVEVGGASVCTC